MNGVASVTARAFGARDLQPEKSTNASRSAVMLIAVTACGSESAKSGSKP